MRYTGESRSFPPNTAFGGLRIQNIHVVDVIKVSLGSWETEVPNENGMASQKKRKEEKKEEGISLKKKKKSPWEMLFRSTAAPPSGQRPQVQRLYVLEAEISLLEAL